MGDETSAEIRDEIQEGFARALFVTAWTDACGELTGEPGDDSIACYACGAEGVGAGAEHADDCAALAIVRRHSAGSGEDWCDVAPETSEHARAIAARVVAQIEASNGVRLAEVYARNAREPGHEREPSPELFGHYLAMEWLGHGVAWSDSHPEHGLQIGDGEYGIPDVRDTSDAWPAI